MNKAGGFSLTSPPFSVLLGADVCTHVSVLFHWPEAVSCVLSPLPECPQRLRQPQSLGVPVVMDTPSGDDNCEVLEVIPLGEPHVPGYQRVERQLGPRGDGSP